MHVVDTEYQTTSLTMRTRLQAFLNPLRKGHLMSEKLSSKQLSKKITEEYMEEAFHAHEKRKAYRLLNSHIAS